MAQSQPDGRADTKILVAEDDPLVRLFFEDMLEDMGFRSVVVAADRDEALRLAAEQRPQIAILDVNLRGQREGILLGQNLAQSGVPLIFVSGYADIAADPEVVALQPLAVMPKPCLPSELEAVLVEACQNLR